MDTRIHLLVLNHNGRALLRECLPSIVAAAEASRHDCQVTVVDNASTDDSLAWIAEHAAGVDVVRCENQGLISFNAIVPQLDGRVAILLNNDIKLATDAIDPLVAPLLAASVPGERPCFLAAPRCWRFDNQTYEGFRTAVCWRWGVLQATALFDGHQSGMDRAGTTASAGAVMAVDRDRFVELGGFDPLYLPGRIEDLDFCWRGYQRGYVARYVPQSVAWHKGHASFGPALGQVGSERLALRNTLLFQWQHLRTASSIGRQFVGGLGRLLFDLARCPVQSPARRFLYARAWRDARRRWREYGARAKPASEREAAFFEEFAPARLAHPDEAAHRARWLQAEGRRDANYPLSQWYLRPLARWIALRLQHRSVAPWQITLLGLLATVLAVAQIDPGGSVCAAVLLMLAWLCDRTDGPLARLQQSVSPTGAWLDANVDELTDLGLHAIMAAAAASAMQSTWPWMLLVAFVIGKYLLMYGLHLEQYPPEVSGSASSRADNAAQSASWWRWCYHLPANADVRMHLAIAALATGWFTAELAFLACYYNARWLARWALVPWRLARGVPKGATV